jgi:hypothetical protein
VNGVEFTTHISPPLFQMGPERRMHLLISQNIVLAISYNWDSTRYGSPPTDFALRISIRSGLISILESVIRDRMKAATWVLASNA